jgi:hypothetical protein
MIPLIFLFALGLGAFATYELSPKAHAWVDEHVRDAIAAHDDADAHLDVAGQIAAQPVATQEGWIAQVHATRDRVLAAHAATSAAASSTAQAAATAKTPQQRAVATWMAALTLAKQDQIRAYAAASQAQAPQARVLAQSQFADAAARVLQAKNELGKLGVNS